MKRIEVNGFCEMCMAEGRYTAGKIVHHIEPITDKNYLDDDLMYGSANLMFVCDDCHKQIHGNTEDFYFDSEGNVCQRK